MLVRRAFPLLFVALALVPPAVACDVCSVFTFLDARESPRGWYGGAFVQSQTLDQLLVGDDEIDNVGGERIQSLNTQVYAGYQFDRRFGLQLSVPWIRRGFRRLVEGAHHGESAIESGDETGLGDIALVGHFRAVERHDASGSWVWSLLAGAKLPTGNSDPLTEAHDHAAEATPHAVREHGERAEHGPVSAVGGDDLALGSGSTDFILGTAAFWSHGRFKLDGRVQYTLRQEGDHDYRFGDELAFAIRPGYFVSLTHAHAIGLGVHLTGEDKDDDRHDGERLPGTDLSALFAGPSIFFSARERWSGEVEADLPVRRDTTGRLLVSDWRIRASLTRSF